LNVKKNAESLGKTYLKSDFPSLFLDGLSCNSASGKCPITNIDTTSGDMGAKFECPVPFVLKW
jgi:hypothetical protein